MEKTYILNIKSEWFIDQENIEEYKRKAFKRDAIENGGRIKQRKVKTNYTSPKKKK